MKHRLSVIAVETENLWIRESPMASFKDVEKMLKLWKSLGKEKIRLKKTKDFRLSNWFI
jgi:hypothetical protein